MKFVYFGHSRMLYSTEEEKKALELIKNIFPNHKIINPNTEKHQKNCNEIYTGVPGTEMQYFLNLTKMCEFGIFLVYNKNKWSPGSYTEATFMIENGKTVFALNIDDWNIRQIKEIKNHFSFREEKDKLNRLNKKDI